MELCYCPWTPTAGRGPNPKLTPSTLIVDPLNPRRVSLKSFPNVDVMLTSSDILYWRVATAFDVESITFEDETSLR
jgi:hypothetical protein